MFDDTKQSEDELFDQEETPETEDDADQGDDTEDILDDLEGEPKPDKSEPTPGEIARQKQIDVWTRKVASGETSMEEMPKNLGWLKPHIQANLRALAKEPDIEQLVEKKFTEAQDKKTFAELRQKLNEGDLTAAQKKTVAATYKKLRAKGLLAGESLEIAMAPMEINISPKEMKIPKRGRDISESNSDTNNNIETESFWKQNPDERIKKLAKLVK